jgi:hypothetical protein
MVYRFLTFEMQALIFERDPLPLEGVRHYSHLWYIHTGYRTPRCEQITDSILISINYMRLFYRLHILTNPPNDRMLVSNTCTLLS